MSNELAITAVTATLRELLTAGLTSVLAGGSVTTKPPDKARDPNNLTNQVNLFLYSVSYDAAWTNMNMPSQIKPNETGFPPLPLVLHYLITAYSKEEDAEPHPVSHTLLGTAMRVLHDHPLLGADELKTAFTDSDLGEQIERVRITPQQLSVDEMSKLWTTFQTNYRISAAYQVSVVLIESLRSPRTPLPVLTRGKDDTGVSSQPDLTPPFPTLTDLTLPKKQPSARLGDTITLEGFHLDGNTVTAQFSHPRLPTVNVTPTSVTETKVEVKIPSGAPTTWASGAYTVSLLIQKTGEQDRVTNEFPFTLAPTITSALPLSVTISGGDAEINIKFTPEVLPEQRAMLSLSDKDARQIPAEPHATQTDTLKFIVKDASVSAVEGFFIRLRVDGVDSLLIKDYEAAKPEFDANQKVKIKP
jgi:Pvc16 N-terminal domain